MLVLTRKIGDAVQIGGEIELEIVKTNANRVKLSISAPPSVRIRRAEVTPSTTSQVHYDGRRTSRHTHAQWAS